MIPKNVSSYEYTQEELLGMISKMRAVCSLFYQMAASTGVHPFLEWTGLMSKMVDLYERAAKEGIDFTSADVHGSTRLTVEDHDIVYFAEKFRCIFSGILTTPALVRLFVEQAGLAQRAPAPSSPVTPDAHDLWADGL